MKPVYLVLAAAVLGLGLPGAFSTEKPVALYPGLGSWHHPIATRSPEAQKFFDQGLTLAYGFNRYEALRSFRHASELDPNAPMTYWGMAFAQGPYINMDGDPSFDLKGACAAAASGLKLNGITDHERAYLEAANTWCPEYKPTDYSDAMRRVAQTYPDDPDARTLYADSLLIPVRWHWYSRDGTPATGVSEAESVLQDVLRRWPQHPGANHYYVHSVESSATPERAIPSAQRLMGIVPWAGHMVHMPGHIWLVLGDWETAASVNERAAEVDREYFSTTDVTGGTYTPYYWHNLHFILYARSMQGRKKDSLEAAETLSTAASPMAQSMPEMADAFLALPILIYTRFGEWDRIKKSPEPPASMPASHATWLYARTLAFLASGDQQRAAHEQAKFEELCKQIPAGAPWGQNKAREVLAMASEVLAARFATNPEDATGHWQRAVDLQDRLVYDEPPAWYYPVRESQGAALLRAGKPDVAETVFREGLRRSPRNGRMLFGLMESLKAQGKQDDAEWVRQEFARSWSNADVSLRVDEL